MGCQGHSLDIPDMPSCDSVWGSDIPAGFKHWDDVQKVLFSVFSQVGVGKVMLRLETVDNRFQVFANATIAALHGVGEELTALHLMMMQNRMVLDLLTTSQGGVGAMVGDYCCTYIPGNNADSHVIDIALKNLTWVQKAMVSNGVPFWLR